MSRCSVLLIQLLTNSRIPFLRQSCPIACIGLPYEPPAGIAKSWRTNRENAYQAYLQDVVDYAQAKAKAQAEDRMSAFKRKEPIWNEWCVPILRVPVIQANANVVVVEPSQESTFDYWLRVSTLDKGTPLRVPVKLAPYHNEYGSFHGKMARQHRRSLVSCARIKTMQTIRQLRPWRDAGEISN